MIEWRNGVLLIGMFTACCLTANLHAQEASDASELVARGEYVARLGDCEACHVGPDGTPYAGGNFLQTPLGAIMGTNITSSKEYGIGGYSEADLRAVLHEGKAPDRMLYPAMPYPSYHGMKDEDIHALYAYLQTVEPVEHAPDGETDLDFPFNWRFLMRFYNVLALDNDTDATDSDEGIARGDYLVNHLGHCGTCHTPRNDLMMADESRYLGGAPLNGWEAPNITPDPIGGLGAWAIEDIVEYLQTGRALGVAQASGPMAEAVHYSTRYLNEDDLTAIARYLKSVPALKTRGQTRPLILPAEERPGVAHEYGAVRADMAEALERTDMSATETLFLNQCAACHGVGGQGQPEAYYPALVGNSSARREDPSNLIMVIAQGVKHSTLYRAPLMPGFENDLDAREIADLGNYVRVEFGGFANSSLSASDVNATLNPTPDLPFAIRHAALLAWIGIALVLCVLAAIVWLVWRHRSNRVEG